MPKNRKHAGSMYGDYLICSCGWQTGRNLDKDTDEMFREFAKHTSLWGRIKWAWKNWGVYPL